MALKCLAQANMEPPLAQILVVVANIRMRSWMTEVEEGFVSTAVEHELANPKLYGKSDSNAIHRTRLETHIARDQAKGNPVTIPEPVEYTFAWRVRFPPGDRTALRSWQHESFSSRSQREVLEEFSFLFYSHH